MFTNSTPVDTSDDNEKALLLDILHNGAKIGVVPDVVPDEFDTDDECRSFIIELKALPSLSAKHNKTLDCCLLILEQDNDQEITFGPSDILVLSELAFRIPTQGIRIMSLLQYLMSCLDFVGTVPDGFYADVGSAYGYLGSIIGKDDADKDGANLDDDDAFGFDLGDSLSDSDNDECADADDAADIKHTV